MIQESSCDSSSSSSSESYGLMQVSLGPYNQFCSGKLTRDVSFEFIKGSSGNDGNIECGIRILNGKYSEFGGGVYNSWSYKNSASFKNLVDSCVGNYPEYADYRGGDAALRGYNGWGCDPRAGADVNFVDNVLSHYNSIEQNYIKIASTSSGGGVSA